MNIQIELIFGVLSTCLSIIIHFSKIKDSILSYRAKAKYTSIPAHLRIENILRYFVCSSWLMYSSYLKDKYILISNVIGFIFFWFWLILIFFLYFRKINFIKYFMFLLLSILFVPGIYFMLYFSLYFGGKICAVICAISYFGFCCANEICILLFFSLFLCRKSFCGNSSVGRALASQAEGRGFESRLPLKVS